MRTTSRAGSADRRRQQRGAGLIVIIGVIAALAVSAAALVLFTGNVQHNTLTTRQQTKSFAVCEAGLDASMALFTKQWPVLGSIPTFDTAAFRQQFSTSEFPNPATGQFISLDWYDNTTPVNTAVRYDGNGDNRLWLVAQSNVGSRATRVFTLVERAKFTLGLPRGIPLWAAGDAGSNNTKTKIFIEVGPPVGSVTTVYTANDTSLPGSGILAPDVTPKPSAGGSVTDIISTVLRDSLVQLAKDNGRYFTTLAAAKASPVNATWSPQGGLSGLCVIETTSGVSISNADLPSGNPAGSNDFNTEDVPGVLMILGGGTFSLSGNVQFWGLIYCEGPATIGGSGTPEVHGMLVSSTGQVSLDGEAAIYYNDNCISRLDQRFPSVVRRVSNTWREVQPI